MKKTILFCVVSSLLFLSGCQTLNFKERQKLFKNENTAFVGKTYDELIKEKGVPTGTATLTNSGKVVEYFTTQTEVSGGGYYGYPGPLYYGNGYWGRNWGYYGDMSMYPVQSWTSSCKLDFVVSPQSVVESWKYEGNGCF